MTGRPATRAGCLVRGGGRTRDFAFVRPARHLVKNGQAAFRQQRNFFFKRPRETAAAAADDGTDGAAVAGTSSMDSMDDEGGVFKRGERITAGDGVTTYVVGGLIGQGSYGSTYRAARFDDAEGVSVRRCRLKSG